MTIPSNGTGCYSIDLVQNPAEQLFQSNITGRWTGGIVVAFSAFEGDNINDVGVPLEWLQKTDNNAYYVYLPMSWIYVKAGLLVSVHSSTTYWNHLHISHVFCASREQAEPKLLRSNIALFCLADDCERYVIFDCMRYLTSWRLDRLNIINVTQFMYHLLKQNCTCVLQRWIIANRLWMQLSRT